MRATAQVVNLHYMLSKATVKARPSVLWCYKKDLYLSSHRKKRVNQVKKLVARGLLDPEKEDPFSLFVASTNIRYCYYSETHTVLGQTFGMCVLQARGRRRPKTLTRRLRVRVRARALTAPPPTTQDFEALTPNLLARTMETVEGGGIIVLLISSLDSLSKLYTMSMDVHARFRTESHQQASSADAAAVTLRVCAVGVDADARCAARRSRAASTSGLSCRWRATRAASSWTMS